LRRLTRDQFHEIDGRLFSAAQFRVFDIPHVQTIPVDQIGRLNDGQKAIIERRRVELAQDLAAESNL
jgi:hypothetical protein